MNNNLENKNDFHFIYFLLVCLLALVVLAESLIVVKGKQANKNANLEPAPTTAPSLIAEEKKGVFYFSSTGQTQVQLNFNSSNVPVGGLDAILIFDPKALSIKKITPSKELFNQFAINDKDASAGRIKITAYSPKKQLTGIHSFASMDFEVLSKTGAKFSYEFSGPDSSKDSNLVSQISQKDILGKVIPFEIPNK